MSNRILGKVKEAIARALDKELREKIARILFRAAKQLQTEGCPDPTPHIDQILALIEEARLQGYATGCDATTKGFSHAVEEARRQEREMVISFIEEKATFVVAEKSKLLLKFVSSPNGLILAIEDWQALTKVK